MKSLLSFLFVFLTFGSFAQPGFSTTIINATEMVLVKGGEFQMGNPHGKYDARPVHTVKLQDYYIGKFEVTQSLWQMLMMTAIGYKSDCTNCPVYDVNSDSLQLFIAKLNQLTGKHYRLPTEAEWEYAACGGNQSKGYQYSGSDTLDRVAWYRDDANGKTHPVAGKQPNELGLYDMSGNVWELCTDWYNARFYKYSPKENPSNTTTSKYRVVRGGSWRGPEERCRTRARNRDIKDHHIGNQGFRLVMDK